MCYSEQEVRTCFDFCRQRILEQGQCGRRVLCAHSRSAQTIFVFFLCCIYRATEMHHHYHRLLAA
jgi:hypothetical protein